MPKTLSSCCPLCAGDGVPLGTLGRLRWFRCRQCGATYHRNIGCTKNRKDEGDQLDTATVAVFKAHAESLVALSSMHLTPHTRQKLVADDLSVNTYPTEHGGFVFIGSPRYQFPQEPDLAMIFEAAERAGIVWLKFDSDAAVIDGLPLFENVDLRDQI